MLQRDWRLLNFDTVDAIPAALARARGNAAARTLAGSDWLVRRKADGRYLAAVRTGASPRWQPLAASTAWPREAVAGGARPIGAGEQSQALFGLLRDGMHAAGDTLPLDRVQRHLAALGIPADYGTRHGLRLVPEPRVLAFADLDRYRRPLFLHANAASAWRRMRAAAAGDGIVLDAISGFRSHAYQLGIFARKRARGQSVDGILRVNAAPGYSEHHGGHALDIGTPGEPPAEESFEATPAFAWLTRRAGGFGFTLSYPRGNPHGIVYEPWHWAWSGG